MQYPKCLAIGALALAPALAYADDWACEVVLCLSNPAGAMAVTECVPPIQKLWRELAKGHAFPTCNMNSEEANGNSASNSWANGRDCPSQYRYWGGPEGDELLCQFGGVVTVRLANQVHTRVWWNVGESYTQNFSHGVPVPDGATLPLPPAQVSGPTAGEN